MGSSGSDRTRELFRKAVALQPRQRVTFLDQACGTDTQLRAAVESMLSDPGRTTLTESTSHAGPQAQSIGPYKILQKLGEGGMGEVFLAEQQGPIRRRVALKTIKWGMDTKKVMARFDAERQALALMDHPNVAKVLDAGATEQGRPYFVMEHVKGVPINEHCDRQRLTTRERLELFVQVCDGLQHAHRKGIIHRDIKPGNVLVTIRDDRAVPKIIDFGVAKAMQHRLTEQTLYTELGQIIGTPEYMSPEQAEMTGQDIDTRTDVYSLGVMLYELLVGALPFDPHQLRRAGFDEMRRRIREDDPPKPSTRASSDGTAPSGPAARRRTDVRGLARQLRGELDWIVMKALEKDRTRRYGSPKELAEDVQRYLSHEAVLAGAPGTFRRLAKALSRRRPLVTAVASIVLLAAVAGIGLRRSDDPIPASSAPRIASLAVLPFSNLAASPEQEYFVDGMTEEMISTLGTIGELQVRGRRSTMQYKGTGLTVAEIARDLKVDAVVDGAVLLTEDRVRVNAELIDARTQEALWRNSYERDLENILALQGELALAIAEQIHATLTPQQRSRLSSTRRVNPRAHDLYLKGKHLLGRTTPEEWSRALDLFQRAIEIDRDSAEAHSGVARAYGLLMGYSALPQSDTDPKIREAARKALELDETLAFAHIVRAQSLLWLDWDWQGAERELQRALELNPSSADARHTYAWYLYLTDRPREGQREIEQARQIENLSLTFMLHLATFLYYERRYEEALALIDSALELEPDERNAQFIIGQIYAQQGKTEQALELYREHAQSATALVPVRATLAYVHAIAGQPAQALRMLGELLQESNQRQVDAYYLAMIATGLGDRDRAFGWLEQACNDHNIRLPLLKLDPLWDPLRDDPRYPGILECVGLRVGTRDSPGGEPRDQS